MVIPLFYLIRFDHITDTMVTLAVYALHHHPDVWENPEVCNSRVGFERSIIRKRVLQIIFFAIMCYLHVKVELVKCLAFSPLLLK